MEADLSEQVSSKRMAFPLILTGNDLLAGHVVYFGGAGWSADPAAAFVATDAAGAETLEAALDETAVVEPYLVTTALDAGGRPLPVHYREKIRLIGPTYALEGSANVPL
jgi:hypothetical protein